MEPLLRGYGAGYPWLYGALVFRSGCRETAEFCKGKTGTPIIYLPRNQLSDLGLKHGCPELFFPNCLRFKLNSLIGYRDSDV